MEKGLLWQFQQGKETCIFTVERVEKPRLSEVIVRHDADGRIDLCEEQILHAVVLVVVNTTFAA